jgi:hypothetical protein
VKCDPEKGKCHHCHENLCLAYEPICVWKGEKKCQKASEDNEMKIENVGEDDDLKIEN